MSIKIKNKKDGQAEKELAQKVGLFNKLEDECYVCETPFDKKNKEMVMSWYVTVKEERGEVMLYCPTCWTDAMKLVKEGRG